MNGKYEEKGFLVAKLIMDDKLNQIKQNEREIESSVSNSSISRTQKSLDIQRKRLPQATGWF